ncbi:PREDICTED: myosin-2-like [Ipomoea nil]|uniref:myosin-2-like n=1 Tax=Ipomoea nil TaxID=35883 RepID=UPI000901C55D|nr:PREDICTED: myosin-2-like [Ipomoea nil]XP_019169165.1 PREDICTED: myosin-2-like [Ipomoea nil]XP_019169172.1 PREDICTED: myosin-2-like [Ipomoea nil]
MFSPRSSDTLMATCQMRTLSSLELLLVKLQQAPEEEEEDAPPALPPRPVKNSRLPRARKKLPLNLRSGCCDQEMGKINDLSASRGMEKRAFLDSDNLKIQISIEEDEKQLAVQKGVEIIQRCYHGHQARHYYNELKRGAIVLQSFVRGENARKDYQFLVTRLRAIVTIQKHMKEQQSRRLEQLAAVICLQSGIRGWLTRIEFNKKITSRLNSRQMLNPELKDEDIKVLACTNGVQRSVLLDLQRRVAVTEAALERTRDENASLKEYILQFDKKSQEYEAKMQCLEKSWQDQLMSIQTSLGAASRSEGVAENGLSRTEPPSERFIPFERSDAGLVVNNRLDFASPLDQENGSHQNMITWVKSGHDEPLNLSPKNSDVHKVKLRFKAWKKDYKSRLQVVKATLKQLRHCDRGKST